MAAAKIDKLESKVWNPNSPDSWEADMRGYHAVKDNIVCPEAKELVKLNGTRVLDVGCAKGFWLENEDDTFDYVHQRMLVLGMPKDRFPDALNELIRVTKPGGWIELVEADIMIYHAGPYAQKFSAALLGAMQARGLNCYAATNLEWYPINEESPLGRLCGRNGKAGFLAMEDWMHKSMGITREEYRKLLGNCFNEVIEYQSFAALFSSSKEIILEYLRKTNRYTFSVFKTLGANYACNYSHRTLGLRIRTEIMMLVLLGPSISEWSKDQAADSQLRPTAFQ
ncbi:hypothetical protein HK100_007517 [Physocladia obscura]|uniref:Methyltransferase n=1 Tax=Physocladia obscura TaxID=109957 RepID=A0AAD5XK05_9FUNG|nr:hypothetical protein HK100_007517 [Physocladia obscura]